MSQPPAQWPPPGPPPGGPYPGWGGPWPPAPPPGRSRTVWWILAAAVVLAVVIVAGAVVVMRSDGSDSGSPGGTAATSTAASATSTTAPTESVKPVPSAALTGLLLNPDEAAGVLGAPAPLIGDFDPPNPQIFESMVVDDPIVDQDCQVLYVAERMAYEGSGYNDVRVQFLISPNRDKLLAQAVVGYVDAAAAQKYLGTAKAAWERCANRNINVRTASDTAAENDFWVVGPVTEQNGVVLISRRAEGGGSWVCRQGKAARNNIVIDVKVCGDNLPESMVTDYIDRVDAKIKAQR